MIRKLKFSTLVAFVNVPQDGYVPLLNELNQVKRRQEFKRRTKVVSDHRCVPVVTKLLGGERFDARSFSFTHWLVWASTLEGEGYCSSVIVVPVRQAVRVQEEHMDGLDYTYGGRVSFGYFDVTKDVATFIGFVRGWIAAPRAAFTPLNLDSDRIPHNVVIGADIPDDYVGEDPTALVRQGEGDEPMTEVGTPDLDEGDQGNDLGIQLVAVDGVPVKMAVKEEEANG